MKKLLTALLAVVASCCLSAAFACHTHTYSETEWDYDENTHWHPATCSHTDQKGDEAEHDWVATDDVDEDGNVVYICSVCGYEHVHTFEEKWTTSTTAHWHAASCSHTELYSDYEEHDFEDGYCIVCGAAYMGEVELYFSFYTDDDADGTYGSDSDTYRGVTYTAVEYSGCVTVEDVTGGANYLYVGDKIAFTVTKSVFCSYTDSLDYPLVYANEDAISPDDDGIYFVTVTEDTVITVGNVETNSQTIGGKGTASDPYTINSLIDWLYFAYMINDKSWFNSLDYNIAYWKLTCDLDFGGESIYIIGDGYSSSYSMFMGNFDGGGYTISNFALDNSVYGSTGEYAPYIGVFGVLAGYAGVDTCIKNLNVENYTIEAGASSDSNLYVGGLVGFISGASVINCNVSGCTFDITADDSYGAFIGGIAGICQSGYIEDTETVFYSTIQYCSVDVDISGSGFIYETGGIVGRTVPYSELAPIFIYNNYTTGVYTGASHTGGIVGYAGSYTSVQNCYSTAEISVSSTQTSVYTGYEDTMLDYRYSYAGGIVGYAENETYIGGCFFKGAAPSASSSSGTDYALAGQILGGSSAAGFENYRAQAVYLYNNLTSSDAITDDIIKNTLGWNTGDWTFNGDGYPVINTESTTFKFTITISVSGATTEYEIDSQYMPMAYWYIATDDDGNAVLPQYLTSGTSRTYGYYFDEELTKPVPACYIPMDDVTLYAKYADCSEVAGTYEIYSNGISATLTINSDGTYSLDQGVIYLTGDCVYNGTYISFGESYFARFAASATSTQQETYYYFWAEINSSGDLIIYDCATVNEVSETYDEYGLTYLARVFAYSAPLTAMASAHSEVCGSYYTADGETYVFNIGYTGTTPTSAFTYAYEDGVLTVTMTNGQQYTATITDGKVSALTRGTTVISLTAYDDFEGTWEQKATISKSYSFDGMGGWIYYVNGEEISEGAYTINSNGELVFTRGSVSVTVTLNADGTLNVKESTGSVAVTYYGEGGYMGTWYTAANPSYRYTLVLSGLDGDGVGTITLTGTGVSISDLRYISVGGVLYAYEGDDLYATLTYDEDTALLTGDFDGTTYVFYLYDDFYGEWFSSIEGLQKLTFNGLGAYDTPAVTQTVDGERYISAIAVSGSVTIENTTETGTETETVTYSVNEDGDVQFTYNGVTYVISYDENNNEVSVTYNGATGKLIAGDTLYGVTYCDGDGVTYLFDGAGNLTDGGTVVVTDGDGEHNYTYVISNGVVTIYSDYASKTVYATATPAYDADGEVTSYGFEKSGAACSFSVSNYYTGTWVLVGGYVTYEIPEIAYYEAGSTLQLTIYYISDTYSYQVPLTAYYDGSTLWFEFGTETYYMNYLLGYMLLTTTYDPTDDDDAMYMTESDGYRKTYTCGSDSVKLGGNSTFIDYDNFGDVVITIDGVEYDYIYKVAANGDITILEEVENEDGTTSFEEVYTFNVVASADGAYECDGEYRELKAIEQA